MNVDDGVHACAGDPVHHLLYAVHLCRVDDAVVVVGVPGHGHAHRFDAPAGQAIDEGLRDERLAPARFPGGGVLERVADVGAEAQSFHQGARVDTPAAPAAPAAPAGTAWRASAARRRATRSRAAAATNAGATAAACSATDRAATAACSAARASAAAANLCATRTGRPAARPGCAHAGSTARTTLGRAAERADHERGSDESKRQPTERTDSTRRGAKEELNHPSLLLNDFARAAEHEVHAVCGRGFDRLTPGAEHLDL